MIGHRDALYIDEGENTSRKFQKCFISDACQYLPPDAQLVSLKLNGLDLPVGSADDVLVQVCRMMATYNMSDLKKIMDKRDVYWIKSKSVGMRSPCRVLPSCSCYVDLDGGVKTQITRAVQILEWAGWRKDFAWLTYKTGMTKAPLISQSEGDMFLCDGDMSDSQVETKVSVLAPISIPTDDVVRTLVLALLKQGRDGGEAWENLHKVTWCRYELGIQNALLHKLKPWERQEAYSQEYSVLDSHDYPEIMILKDVSNLKQEVFIDWMQDFGLSRSDVENIIGCKQENSTVAISNPQMLSFSKDVLIHSSALEAPTISSSKTLAQHQGDRSPVPQEDSSQERILKLTRELHNVDEQIKNLLEKKRTCEKELAVLTGEAQANNHGERLFSYAHGDVSEPTGSRPLMLKVGDDEYPLHFWRDILSSTCDAIGKVDMERLKAAALAPGMLLFSRKSDTLRRARLHSASGLYYESNAATNRILHFSRRLFMMCGFDLSQIKVSYYMIEGSALRNMLPPEPQEQVRSLVLSPPAFDDEIIKKMKALLAGEFRNGVRTGSVIDRNKVKRAWENTFHESPPDVDWDSLLRVSGMVYDGKVFPLDVGGEALSDFIRSLVEKAHGIFFYDTLFDAERDAFLHLGIQSGDMLKSVLLQKPWNDFRYGQSSFVSSDMLSGFADILFQAFSGQEHLTIDALIRHFPYVPSDKIRQTLALDGRFIHVREGCYGLTSSIQLDNDECVENAKVILAEVAKNGFSSLKQYMFPRSLELNGDVERSAIETKFYKQYLMHSCDRHCGIVCRKGEQINSLEIVKEFCRSRDEATPEEVISVVREMGLSHTSTFLETAHREMVRASEDKFVSPRFVRFDVDGCDMALDEIVPSIGVMPLCAVRSFVSFPLIPMFPWNCYLLESYLRRESKRYEYMANSWNARPRGLSGAIVRRGSGITSFDDALAHAVVVARVPLVARDITEFLAREQYIRRGRESVGERIVELARRIVERNAAAQIKEMS